nr:protein SSUH2 homolog isoform X1 [Danio rerio]|eukprot:XP_021329218.1 protein SSUH2 homolog isoform X1 [Danio rerio]
MDEKDEDIDTLDPSLPEEGPTAPPPGWLDTVSGYEENTGGDCPPPPDFVPKPENDKNASVPNVMVPSVSEDTARDALLQFVGKKWTYSSKPAKNLIFKELKPFTVYRYRLETFTESRSSAWESEPHTALLLLSW